MGKASVLLVCALLILAVSMVFVSGASSVKADKTNAASSSSSVLNFPKYQGNYYEPGKIIVKFKQAPVLANKKITLVGEVLSSDTGEPLLKGKTPIINNLYIFNFNSNRDISKVIQNIKKNSNVEYAEPDYIGVGLSIPNDPNYSQQWNFPNTGAPAGWDITTGNESILIATIDSGIDWKHPDLINKIWQNLGEDTDNDEHTIEWNGTDYVLDSGDINTVDDDGNGYVDDLIGYDFVSNGGNPVANCASAAGEDCSTNDNDPLDRQGHGTFQYGLMGAETNNAIGIAGLCQNCKLMAIRSAYNSTLSRGAFYYTSNVVNGINYAVNNGIKSINLAFGVTDQQTIHNAIINATNRGVLVTCAAGNYNDSNPTFPASYSECFAVGARDQNDARYSGQSGSTYGSWVDISAPSAPNLFSTSVFGSYKFSYGTSYASPQVTGLAGLILSKNPTLTNIQVRQIINDSADYIATDYWIGGRINVTRALLMTPLPNSAPVLASIGDKQVDEGQLLEIDVNASDEDNDNLTYYTDAGFGSFDSATGMFTWRPNYSQSGIYNVTFNVSDNNGGWDSETIQINVSDVTSLNLNGKLLVKTNATGNNSANLNVSLKNMDTLGITNYNLLSDYSGNFIINGLSPAQYSVWLKPLNSLAVREDGLWLSELIDFGIAGVGDLNNDNKVNYVDIGTVSYCYGQNSSSELWGFCSLVDFNLDGDIDYVDAAVFSGNYNTQGALGF